MSRNNWKENEIDEMFNVIKSSKILSLSKGRKYRSFEVYMKIEKKLMQKGIHRSAEQIRNKLKSMRCLYYNVKNNKMKLSDVKLDSVHFDLLDKIFGNEAKMNFFNNTCNTRNESTVSTKKLQPLVIWSYQETEDLIGIIRSKLFRRISNNKSTEKLSLFKEIEKEFNSNGYCKTYQQIILKWKELCSMYRDGINNYDSNIPIHSKRFIFFQKMHQLFQEKQNQNVAKNTFEDNLLLDDPNSEEDNYDSNDSIINYKETNSLDLIEDDSSISSQENNFFKKIQNKRKITKGTNNSSNLKRKNSTDSENSVTLKEQRITASLQRSQFKKDSSFYETFQKRSKDDNSLKFDKCVDYLVNSFKLAQTELQDKFYMQQLKLQKQQQEWEEKVLDEEREFLSKMFKLLKNEFSTQNCDL